MDPVNPTVDEPIGTADAPNRLEQLGFDEFYRREMPKLVALARGLCAQKGEDVAQEAMLAAYRRWREVRSLDHPEAWVRRTCANMAVSAFRRQLIEVKATLRLSVRSGAAVRVAGIDREAAEFWELVQALPRRQAQCAALRYVFDMDIAGIAQTLQIGEGSVKVHLARGRERLAKELRDLREEDR